MSKAYIHSKLKNMKEMCPLWLILIQKLSVFQNGKVSCDASLLAPDRKEAAEARAVDLRCDIAITSIFGFAQHHVLISFT